MFVLTKKKMIRVALSLYLVYTLLPILPEMLPQGIRYVVLLTILGLSVLTAFVMINHNSQMILTFIGIVLFLLLQWIGFYSGIFQSFLSYLMNMILFWIPLIFVFSIAKDETIVNRNIRTLFVALVFVTMITTIIGNIRFPEASRLLAGAASEEESALYGRYNIGGYKFVYLSVLLVPNWCFLMEKQKEIKKKLLGAVMIALTVILAVSAQYSLAMILIAFEIIAIIISKSEDKGRITLIIGAILILLLLLQNQIASLFFILSKVVSGYGYNQIGDRLLSIYNMILGNDAFGSTAGRIELHTISIETFLKSSVFGSLFSTGRIGGHSDFFDVLAATGLFGISVLSVLLWRHIKNLALLKKEAIYRYSCIMTLAFVVLFVSGTALSSSNVGFAVFLVPFIFR